MNCRATTKRLKAAIFAKLKAAEQYFVRVITITIKFKQFYSLNNSTNVSSQTQHEFK
jgi:hypothetical protein